MIVLDVTKPLTQRRKIEYELEGFGMRLNKKPPAIIIKRKEKGGLNKRDRRRLDPTVPSPRPKRIRSLGDQRGMQEQSTRPTELGHGLRGQDGDP